MQSSDVVPVYDSSKSAAPAIEEALELVRYRNLVIQMVRRDIVSRYKRSVLGVAWTMLNPLGSMIILTVVFSQLFKTDNMFPVYILSGQLLWIFFSQTTTDTMVNLISGVTLIQRIYMPRTIFAATAIGNGLFNLFISLVPLAAVMIFIGAPFHPAALLLPIPILLLALFSMGMGLLLSTLAVYFRDVVAMYQVLLTAWMYLTPIIYPENLLEPRLRFWLSTLNPLYGLVKLFRIYLYEGRLPLWGELWPSIVVSVVMFLIGWFVFSRKSNEFAYRI